ncbi:hypothetical protein Sjap_008656 [Stephania japonica]|uniref:RING-type domain-containing protein n=1 Tax=Stephania japonica TaxID=461633 RepID=A0AAP0JSC0_9MAGN
MDSFSSDLSIVSTTSKLLSALDLSTAHRATISSPSSDMDYMDIDLVMEVPDTPDRIVSLQNDSRGEEIEEVFKSSAARNSQTVNLVDKGVYRRARDDYGKLSIRKVNSGKSPYNSGGDGFPHEIRQKSDIVDVNGDSPSISASANVFRKMMTEKVSSDSRRVEKVSTSNDRVKLDNDTLVIVDVLSSGEKSLARNKGKLDDFVSSKRIPFSGRNLSKKLMLHGDKSSDLDDNYVGVTHGGIDFSCNTKQTPEKSFSSSLQFAASPRINGQKKLVRNGLISPSNIAKASHSIQNHVSNSVNGNHGPNEVGRMNAEYDRELNEADMIQRMKGKGVIDAFSPAKDYELESRSIEITKGKGVMEASDLANMCVVDRTKGKGIMMDLIPAKDHEDKTKILHTSSRSLLSPVEEVDRNGEALSHLKEVGGWRSTRNRSKIMPSMLSNELGNLSRGKGNDNHLLHKNRVGTNGNVRGRNIGSKREDLKGRNSSSCSVQASSSSMPDSTQPNGREIERMKLPKRQRKRMSGHSNYGESSSSVFDDSEVTVLWSSHDVSDMGCPRSSDNHGHDIPASVIDINELSPEVLVRSHNSRQMANDDSNNRTKQVEEDEMLARELQEQFYNELEGVSSGEIDANIAWALQQEENAQRASLNRRHHVDSRESSMAHLYRQYPSQYLNNSLVRSTNRANRSWGRTSRRMAQPRNGFHDQYTDLPSFERIQFPPTMDVDTRMHILEALEAAVSDGGGLGRASNIFQFQRDFNENDYEMLSALDEHNPPCGASLNLINGLPQSVVQTDNFEEACAICLETPTVGDTIRHLPCLHKFHKDCIDPWLRRKTSCPVCKSSVN